MAVFFKILHKKSQFQFTPALLWFTVVGATASLWLVFQPFPIIVNSGVFLNFACSCVKFNPKRDRFFGFSRIESGIALDLFWFLQHADVEEATRLVQLFSWFNKPCFTFPVIPEVIIPLESILSNHTNSSWPHSLTCLDRMCPWPREYVCCDL